MPICMPTCGAVRCVPGRTPENEPYRQLELDVSSGRAVWSEEHYRILGRDPVRKPYPTYQLIMDLIDPEDRPSLE
jgi:hypothetical protein